MTTTVDEAAALVALAQRDLLVFGRVADPTYQSPPHVVLLVEYLEAMERGEFRRLLLEMPPQTSKALALDTPIPTPDGWTTMGELHVGDLVFGANGQPCTVTAVSEVFRNHECYRLITDDGHEIVADAGHLWLANLERRQPYRVYTTKALARSRSKRARLPAGGALELPEAVVPIPPYTLGLWLGDGDSNSARVTIGHEDASETLANLAADGTMVTGAVHVSSGAALYRLGGGERVHRRSGPLNGRFGPNGSLQSALRAEGLLGGKRIPERYLRASSNQRLALLQGLIDSDGHVTTRGHVLFTNTNQKLAAGVRELVHSLGVKATMIERRAMLHGVDCGPYWTVSFYMAHAARLARKASRAFDSPKKHVRYVSAIPTDTVPVRCIVVDSPDHLFLAGRGMIPTHNSTHVSQHFPAWHLGRNPDDSVILASYGQELASRNGRRVRELVRSDTWAFETRLDHESSAVHRWNLEGHRGGLISVGVGGGLTGWRGNVIVVDDPHKDAAEADSIVMRDRAWAWWDTVVKTRRASDCIEIITQTRWHDDDLIGRITRSSTAHEWVRLTLPAIADGPDELGRLPGDYLVVDQASEIYHDYDAIKADSSIRTWSALYQQRPVAEGGQIIKREWIRRFASLPPDRVGDDGRLYDGPWTVIQAIDTAWDEGVGHDFSCIATWATDGKDYFLLDLWRGRVQYPDLRRMAHTRYTGQRWRPSLILVEDAANGRVLVQDLQRDGLPVVPVPVPPRSKTARIDAVSPTFESGHVYVPPEGAWVDEYIEEVVGFPQVRNDEQVDVTSLALGRLIPDDGRRRLGLEFAQGGSVPLTPAEVRARKLREQYGAGRGAVPSGPSRISG